MHAFGMNAQVRVSMLSTCLEFAALARIHAAKKYPSISQKIPEIYQIPRAYARHNHVVWHAITQERRIQSYHSPAHDV